MIYNCTSKKYLINNIGISPPGHPYTFERLAQNEMTANPCFSKVITSEDCEVFKCLERGF